MNRHPRRHGLSRFSDSLLNRTPNSRNLTYPGGTASLFGILEVGICRPRVAHIVIKGRGIPLCGSVPLRLSYRLLHAGEAQGFDLPRLHVEFDLGAFAQRRDGFF